VTELRIAIVGFGKIARDSMSVRSLRHRARRSRRCKPQCVAAGAADLPHEELLENR